MLVCLFVSSYSKLNPVIIYGVQLYTFLRSANLTEIVRMNSG